MEKSGVVMMKRQAMFLALGLLFLAALSSAQAANVSLTVISMCVSNLNESIIISNNISANGTCFVITGDSLVLDCDGNTITGNQTGYGITATGRTNITIKNCIIQNFSDAIHIEVTNDSRIFNNSLRNNTFHGAFVQSAQRTAIYNNSVPNNWNGIDFGGLSAESNYNNVTDNALADNSNIAIYIVGSYHRVFNNSASGSPAGIYLSPASYCEVKDNNFTSNNVGAYLSGASYNQIDGNNLSSAIQGADIRGSNWNNLTRNDVSGSQNGIYLELASGSNRIYNLTAADISDTYGIRVSDDSTDNEIMDSAISGTATYGIDLAATTNVTAVNVSGFTTGAKLQGSGSLLSNVRINGSSSECIYVTNADSITISSSVLYCNGASAKGVKVDDAAGTTSYLRLLNSNVSAGSPYSSNASNYGIVDLNRFYVTSPSSGVEILLAGAGGGGGGGGGDASYSNITNNIVMCNTSLCSGAGIKIMDDNNIVRNNSIYNFSGGQGILLDNAAEQAYANSISENYVYNCSDGIKLDGQSKASGAENNTIASNRIEETGQHGIYATGGVGGAASLNVISGNSITNVTSPLSYGIRITQGTANNATDNVIFNVNGVGIEDTTSGFVTGNSVNTSTECISVGSSISVDGNTVISCSSAGIGVQVSSWYPNVRNNSVTNSTYGIRIGVGSVYGNITGNNLTGIFSLEDPWEGGIRNDGIGFRIDDNIVTNSTAGLVMRAGGNTANNNIVANNTYGAYLMDKFAYGTFTSISNSTISGSGEYDVFSAGSTPGISLGGTQDVFINTTFDKSSVFFNGTDDSEITVKWYVRVNVTMNSAPTEAQVNLTSILGNSTMYENSSASTGLTDYVEFTEYVQNRTTNVTYNNHTAYVNKTYGCAGAIRFNDTQMNLTSSLVWNITLDNRAPEITWVDDKGAEDPLSCANTSVGSLMFNVTDLDGDCEINASLSYINYTYGPTMRQAGACTNLTSNGTAMTLNCTGADMAYWDSPGSWTINAFAVDIYNATGSNTSHTMAYNTGIYLAVNNGPINFGNVGKGSADNLNINLPAVNLENCGNVVLNDAITGSNITSTPAGYTMDVGLFKANNETTTAGAITLTYGAQAFQPAGGIAVSTGSAATWDIYSFVTIPTSQQAATYNNGTWTFTPSQA